MWHVKVTHALSGEARYFREWPALLDLLAGVCEIVSEVQLDPPAVT